MVRAQQAAPSTKENIMSKENPITIKATGSVGPTTTCPHCGTTFGTEYFLKEHTVCHGKPTSDTSAMPRMTGIATLTVKKGKP
jgi:hypothetical protein